jgi:hypothetical protein
MGVAPVPQDVPTPADVKSIRVIVGTVSSSSMTTRDTTDTCSAITDTTATVELNFFVGGQSVRSGQ